MQPTIPRAALIQNIVGYCTTTGSSTGLDEMVVDFPSERPVILFQRSCTNSIYWIDFFRHVLSHASNDLLASC
jgi:hypothetical protein